MKNLYLIIFILAIIIGCKKSYTPYNNLNGNWEMVSQMSIFHSENFATGQGNFIQFNNGNEYKMFAAFKMINQGPYRIIKKNTASFNKTFDAIYMGNDGIMNAINVKGDSLIISTAPNDDRGNLIMDGGITVYIRQR